MKKEDAMKKITLKNSFHGTQITILAENHESPGDFIERLEITAYRRDIPRKVSQSAQKRLSKITKALCGMSDCSCGTIR